MKALEFTALNLLFPVILGVHNLEEYARCEEFLRVYQRRWAGRFVTCRVMRDAVILLTITVTVTAALTYTYKTWLLITVSEMFILALVSNAIVHCLLSLKRGVITAGTFSALFLVLPYGTAVAMLLVHQGQPIVSICRLAILSSLASPLVVLAFFYMGHALSRVR